MMSCLVRLRSSLLSTPSRNSFRYLVSEFQHSRFSVHSKSSKQNKLKKREESQMKSPLGEPKEFDALFDEITEIVGTHGLILPKNSSGSFLSFGETKLVNNCTLPVCENAEEKKEDLSCLMDTRFVNQGQKAIIPIVHKVTEIVQGGGGMDSIEEQLEKSGIEFDIEIVDKVLKRCLKVPHLALRFFNWVKNRNGLCHTTQTYNTMMNIAGESKEFGLIDVLLKDMETRLCDKDVHTWTILISSYGRAKEIGKALLMFEKMKKSGIEPDLAAHQEILGSLCNCGKAEIAMEFYMEMVSKEMDLDLNLYKILLKCLGLAGNVNAVHLVADNMIKISHIPEQYVYACVVKSFCLSGRIREALEVIRDLKNKNVAIDPEIIETLVRGLCRADRMSDAQEIVEILKKKDVVDVKLYEVIVDGYLRRDNMSKAFEVFQNVKDSGHTPTVLTYTELLQNLLRLGKIQKASHLYDEMLEKGIELDYPAMTAMVACLVQHNRISEAWTVFNRMKEKGIRATLKCYTIFIKELCKISRIDEILKVLKEAESSKIVIGDDLFNWIITYLKKKGEGMNVKHVMQMQRAYRFSMERGMISSHETSITREPCLDLKNIKSKGQGSGLLEAPSNPLNGHDLQEISKIISSSMTWWSKEEALEKCTVQFTPELVVEVLKNCSLHGGSALRFFSWVEKQSGYSHTMEAYNMAIKAAGRGKDFKYMRSLFIDMKRKGCMITSDTWAIVVMQYGRIGLTEIAMRIFKEMKASGCKPNGSTYKSLMISLCGKKGRKVDEAIQTFGEMMRAGIIPDKETIETYIGCLCEVGKLLDARKCTQSLIKVGFSIPLANSFYIRALCRAGRLEEAVTAVNKVGKGRNSLELYTYGSFVHALLRKGQVEDALAKIESMKQVGICPTVHVYTSLIVYFFKEKQINKALEIFEKMKEEGCEPTIVTYSALIRGYISMGKNADAWLVFNQMKREGPQPDFMTYSMFISCLCDRGYSEEALQLISDMLNVGIVPSTVNFRTVNYGLNREGKQELARTVLKQKWDLQSKRKFLAD